MASPPTQTRWAPYCSTRMHKRQLNSVPGGIPPRQLPIPSAGLRNTRASGPHHFGSRRHQLHGRWLALAHDERITNFLYTPTQGFLTYHTQLPVSPNLGRGRHSGRKPLTSYTLGQGRRRRRCQGKCRSGFSQLRFVDRVFHDFCPCDCWQRP